MFLCFAATLARMGSVGTLASVKQGPPPNMPSYIWGHLPTMTDHMTTANLYAVRKRTNFKNHKIRNFRNRK